MTFLPRLRSLTVLVLIGFALLVLPVIVAIGLTTNRLDSLVRQGGDVVTLGMRTTRGAQMMMEQITTLERNARQYRVIGDTDLLTVYQTRHERLLAILQDLESVQAGDVAEISRVRLIANDILDQLQQFAHDSDEVGETLSQFELLHAGAQELAGILNTRADEALEVLRTRASDLQRLLYWQAAALIPLVLVLAALFTVLIAGPIRQLGFAIRQLGEGDVTRPIAVRGPVDLEDLGHRLDWLRNRLIELEQEKNTFLSHVSHELKTPLANVREGAELLMDGSVGDLSVRQLEVAEILQANSLSLQKKIEDLLNFNAWQDMKARLHYSDCNLREIAQSVVEQHRLSISRLNIQIDSRLDEVRIHADCDKLRVMLDNLISNAVKFSPPGGVIRIRIGQDADSVDIHVIDEGPGIPVEERERVFEAFYQGRQSHRGHVRGTGIGLAVVRECVRAHHGVVEILEGEKPGAHFFVRLPRLQSR